MTSILKTTFLGEIRGKTENGVTQYLGIKYANLKNRLADAELIEKSFEAVTDATNDG
jgi:carboxylesterase type B